MESTEWTTDGLIFCWSRCGLKETSLSDCQLVKNPPESWRTVGAVRQPRFITDTRTVRWSAGLQRRYLCAALCVCSHVSPEVVMVLGLHCWGHTYDEDPEVPLVCVTTILLLFPLCSADLTSPVCHIQSAHLCLCSSETCSTLLLLLVQICPAFLDLGASLKLSVWSGFYAWLLFCCSCEVFLSHRESSCFSER